MARTDALEQGMVSACGLQKDSFVEIGQLSSRLKRATGP
jgi:hypothetical protein